MRCQIQISGCRTATCYVVKFVRRRSLSSLEFERSPKFAQVLMVVKTAISQHSLDALAPPAAPLPSPRSALHIAPIAYSVLRLSAPCVSAHCRSTLRAWSIAPTQTALSPLNTLARLQVCTDCFPCTDLPYLTAHGLESVPQPFVPVEFSDDHVANAVGRSHHFMDDNVSTKRRKLSDGVPSPASFPARIASIIGILPAPANVGTLHSAI